MLNRQWGRSHVWRWIPSSLCSINDHHHTVLEICYSSLIDHDLLVSYNCVDTRYNWSLMEHKDEDIHPLFQLFHRCRHLMSFHDPINSQHLQKRKWSDSERESDKPITNIGRKRSEWQSKNIISRNGWNIFVWIN
jgi:hypothetical protein